MYLQLEHLKELQNLDPKDQRFNLTAIMIYWNRTKTLRQIYLSTGKFQQV